MKEIIKNGASVFLKLIIVGVMSFFLCISFSVLTSAVFTENIGYIAYGQLEGSEKRVELYRHITADGEDTKLKGYEEQGYTVTKTNIRSEMPKFGNNVFIWCILIFCLLILTAFLYPALWHLGAKDSNAVRYKHTEEDNFKGLKIGFIGSIPAFLLYIFLVIACLGFFKDFPLVIYKFVNCTFFSMYNIIFGTAATAGDLSVVRLILTVLPLLIVPVICEVAYYLGYRDISLGEKFIYKKK